MFCIKCHHTQTKVINSRPHKKQASIWRRRTCTSCGFTYTTLETVASEGLLWVSDNKGKKPFSLPALLISLHACLMSQKNAPEDAYWLAMTVFEQIMVQYPTGIVTRSEVAKTAHTVLSRYDEAAGLRYGIDHELIKTKAGRTSRPRYS